MPNPFLSEEWMTEAKAIRAKYEGQTGKVTQSIKVNQVITDVPFGDGNVNSYIDTSSGDVVMDLGTLDTPDVTITTDYATAKALFVDQDQAAAMQAFMTGKIKVQGDMMKMMALQTAMPTDDASKAIAEEIKSITAA
ncbi:MAG: SCP2 sterol-binding domain-containing protein [Ilumatobacteraceae bacterium]